MRGDAIRLATEADFTVGRTLVRPSRGEVVGASGARRLEPRVMQVLIALHRAGGEPVSRETLIADCWGGVVVSENAVDQVIGKLRRLAEAHDGDFRVETLPRIGYRLVPTALSPTASADPLPVAGEPRTHPSRPMRGRGGWMLAGAGLIVAALAFGGVAWNNRVQPWIVGDYQVVAGGSAREAWSALSPDGRWLAYSVTERGGQADIWFRAVSSGEPLQLVGSPDEDYAAAWAPDGEQIAFVRSRRGAGGEPCRIYVKPVPAGLERLVGRCRRSSTTARLSWSPAADALYFSESEHTTGLQASVRRLDLSTAATTIVTRPPPAATGDFDAAAAPDGRRLAFIRSESNDATAVIVQDLRTGEERRIDGNLGASASLDWSADGRSLFVATSRSGQSELWAYDPAGRAEPQRLLLGTQGIGRPSAAPGAIAFETAARAEEIVRVGPGGETVLASGADYASVDVSAAGEVAFISQDTAAWLWLQRPGDQARRLSRLTMTDPRMLAYSPDGRRLLFVGSESRDDTDLYLIDSQSGAVTRLPSPGWRTRRGTFTADGRAIIHPSTNGVAGGVLRRELGAMHRAVNLTGLGWPNAQAAAEGVFASPARGGGVWRIRDGRPPEQVAPSGDAFGAWRVSRGAVYVLERGVGELMSVGRYPLAGGSPQRMAVGRISEFAVDPRSGDLLLIRTIEDRRDIGLLRISRP